MNRLENTVTSGGAAFRSRRPLWWQILLPVSGITVAAVVVNSLFAVVWTTRRHGQESLTRIAQLSAVLSETPFPRSQSVLLKLNRLTGAHYIVLNSGIDPSPVTTLTEFKPEELADRTARLQLGQTGSVSDRWVLGDRSFLVLASKPARSATNETLIVLLPESDLARERWRAVVPTLAVGAMSLALFVPLALLLARRFGRRIALVQEKVAGVALAADEPIRDDWHHADEIHDLVESVNTLGCRLRELQSELLKAEQARLLGQFAGGMAHSIRNSIAGARLALQIHQKRCRATEDETSLSVALRQLTLTEHQLKGMLALGRAQQSQRVVINSHEITRDVLELVRPVVEHAHVDLTSQINDSSLVIADPESLRAGLLNLILNAIEAAGQLGSVVVRLSSTEQEVKWTIEDSGQGPPAELSEQLGQPFVTGKPDGVGLGLALVRRVADDGQGGLRWHRDFGHTCFEFTLPRHVES